MYIKEKDGELVITEKTGCLWIGSLFFVFVGGIFVWGSLGGFSNWNILSTWQLFFAFAMGSLAIATGCWMIFRSPFTKIFVNCYTNTVTHITRGILGNGKNIYRFDQIKHLCLIEGKDSEGDNIWFLAMKLENGETVKLSLSGGLIEENLRDIVFQTNEFMHKQMPSYENNLRLDD